MRAVLVTLSCVGLLLSSRVCFADDGAAARELFARQKKSVGLAVTLEAICPLAGAGALYAGETDKALVLGGLSVLAIGAAVGSAFALVHLDGQHPTGADRVLVDAEQSGAVLVLVGAVVSYAVLRVSGLALAPEAVRGFNAELQQRLGVPPAEPVVPFHALEPGVRLTLHF